MFHKIESAEYGSLEIAFARNQVIAGCNNHRGQRVACIYMLGSPSDTRRGVAASRFAQDVLPRNFGQLFPYQRQVTIVGDHNYIAWRDDIAQTVGGHLQQRATCTKEIYELFGTILAAVRPETAADAATHNHCITMRRRGPAGRRLSDIGECCHVKVLCFYRKLSPALVGSTPERRGVRACRQMP